MTKSKEFFYNREAEKMNMTVKELKDFINKLNLNLVPCHCKGSYKNCTGYELQKTTN